MIGSMKITTAQIAVNVQEKRNPKDILILLQYYMGALTISRSRKCNRLYHILHTN